MKPLIYPKKDRVTGVYAYCQKCKTSIGSGKCQKTKKRIQSCEFPEFHTFRASVVVPHTNGQKRKKKILNTCNLTDAIIQKKEFEAELKQHNFLMPEIPVPSRPIAPPQEKEKSILLIECMDDFVRYLGNEGVKEYKKRKRSKGYITEVKRYFTYMCLAIKGNGVDHTSLRIDEVNETIVEWVHTYLTQERKFKNTTYNKAMGMYTGLFTWLNDKRGFGLENVFIDVTRKKVRTKKVTIDKEEFDILLKTICPELGIKQGKPPRTQFYREWLPLAYEIALETGLRREEYLKMRYADIKTNEQGKPVYIRIENYKVNRIKGYETEEEKEFKIIPITKRMHELLKECEFQKNQKSTDYIIAPNENSNRETLTRFVSSSFAHFWRQTGIDREVFLKHLRKTYLTALAEHFGDRAHIISNHANMDVLTRHYVDDKALIERSEQFSVF